MDDMKTRIKKRRNQLFKINVKPRKNKLLSFLSSLLVIVSLCLTFMIYTKKDEDGEFLRTNFGINTNFINFNNKIQSYLDMIFNVDLFNFEKNESVKVNIDESLTYLGNDLFESIDTSIRSFGSGTIILEEEKDNLYTIIVQLDSGILVTYSNLNESFINIYDRVDKNSLIGISTSYFTLTFIKDNTKLSYEEAKILLS